MFGAGRILTLTIGICFLRGIPCIRIQWKITPSVTPPPPPPPPHLLDHDDRNMCVVMTLSGCTYGHSPSPEPPLSRQKDIPPNSGIGFHWQPLFRAFSVNLPKKVSCVNSWFSWGGANSKQMFKLLLRSLQKAAPEELAKMQAIACGHE